MVHTAATSTEEQVSTIQESDPYDAHLTRSFVPNATRSMTEQETIRHSLHQRQSQHPLSTPSLLMWPTIGGTQINEFTTQGYFTCAFPTHFPTGAADFLGLRQNQVTIGNYFKHLMMYDDGRFAKHPRFRFLRSQQRCDGVHSKLAVYMSGNILMMPNYHWMNFMTWLGGKGKVSRIVCCIMLPVCVVPNNIGSGNAADSWPW